MKHLIAILVAFLLLGSPTLAQEKIPEPENIEDLEGFVISGKPVVCGPAESVLDKIAEFNEVPHAAWIDTEHGNNIMFYINENTGTTTVVEIVDNFGCILSQGMGGAVVPTSQKIKGMPIKYLTF
jgi:hypothetical protein